MPRPMRHMRLRLAQRAWQPLTAWSYTTRCTSSDQQTIQQASAARPAAAQTAAALTQSRGSSGGRSFDCLMLVVSESCLLLYSGDLVVLPLQNLSAQFAAVCHTLPITTISSMRACPQFICSTDVVILRTCPCRHPAVLCDHEPLSAADLAQVHPSVRRGIPHAFDCCRCRIQLPPDGSGSLLRRCCVGRLWQPCKRCFDILQA